MKKIFFLLLSLLVALNSSCRKSKGHDAGTHDTCPQKSTPVIFVHGFLASGDTYANQIMRFSSNGYCAERLVVFDWNTLNQSVDHVTALDQLVNQTLQQTSAEKVYLVGHSAGGNLCYSYLNDPTRSAKVAGYVHIGSTRRDGPAGPQGNIATLNIWSPQDLIVQSGDISGAQNLKIEGKDHYEIATCAETFEAMYRFFNEGKKPQTLQITPQSEVKISGRVLTFGENQPKGGALIHLYEIDQTSGERKTGNPVQTLTADIRGNWGPVDVKTDAYYEFEVDTRQVGERKVFYIREPFKRTNPLVYLRTLPPANSFVGLLFSGLPADTIQTVATIFTANQGVTAGRDSLSVKGHILSTNTFCAPANNTIAIFLYDGNSNQKSDLTAQGFFGQFPFLSSADMYIPAHSPTPLEAIFNGKSIRTKTRKSADGVMILVFE